MPLTRPTLQQINDRMDSDAKDELGLGQILRRSLIKALIRAGAGASHILHGFIERAALNFFPQTATEVQFIDRWAQLKGLSRNAATFAQMNVEFTGTTGGTVLVGAILQGTTEIQYELDAEATVPAAGTVAATITATTAGEAGQLAAGDTVTLATPVAGVSSTVEVTSVAVEGEDQEEVEDYRQRVIDEWQTPAQGGNVNDFISWAKSVTGVTRVWVLQGWLGQGNIGITFVEDGNLPASIIPSPAKVAEVDAAVRERMPANINNLFVFAPNEVTVDPIIQLKPNTTPVQDAVIDQLNDMLQREGQVRDASDPEETGLGTLFDGSIPLSRFTEAISIAPGEEDHILDSPTGTVQPVSGGLLTLGTPTFITLP